MNLKKKKIRKNQRKIGNKLIIYNIYYLKLILINYIFIDIIIYYVYHHQNNIKWGLGIGDWGLGIGDWAQSPIPNPQSPIPIKKEYKYIKKINKLLI